MLLAHSYHAKRVSAADTTTVEAVVVSAAADTVVVIAVLAVAVADTTADQETKFLDLQLEPKAHILKNNRMQVERPACFGRWGVK